MINQRWRRRTTRRELLRLQDAGVQSAEISIAIVNDARIHELNRQCKTGLSAMKHVTLHTPMADEVSAQGRCGVAVACIRTGAPAMMDKSFQDAIEGASATFAHGKSVRMPSGAGHDAQILATIMPAGMLFVPSIGGISHHWSENTADADIVTGAEVYVEACRRLLSK